MSAKACLGQAALDKRNPLGIFEAQLELVFRARSTSDGTKAGPAIPGKRGRTGMAGATVHDRDLDLDPPRDLTAATFRHARN